jgi:hypothetical protein
MSIIIAAPKHRVSHPKGYRLHGILDGTHPRPDEGFVKLGRTPGGWSRKRDLLADEQAKVSKPNELTYCAYVERVVDPFDTSQETLVKVERKVPTQRASNGARKARKPGRPRLTNLYVDQWIRENAPTFTGEITPTMRKLARDVISHQESVAEYVAG